MFYRAFIELGDLTSENCHNGDASSAYEQFYGAKRSICDMQPIKFSSAYKVVGEIPDGTRRSEIAADLCAV